MLGVVTMTSGILWLLPLETPFSFFSFFFLLVGKVFTNTRVAVDLMMIVEFGGIGEWTWWGDDTWFGHDSCQRSRGGGDRVCLSAIMFCLPIVRVERGVRN